MNISDPYHTSEYCPNGHTWQAGMMVVHPEDCANVAAGRPVICANCDDRFIPATPATGADVSAEIPTVEDSDEDTMSLADKISALRSAGFSLGWADTDAGECGFFVPREIQWEARVDHWKVTDAPDTYGHPYGYNGTVPYVDLGKVARGEDTYGNTSTIDRSNFRSLMRDYPQVEWRNVHYANQDSLGAYVSDIPGHLIETLCRLADDYPVYDESDMSELEHDEITASWDDYMADEIKRELSEPAQLMWERLGDAKISELWWEAVGNDVFGNYPEHAGVEILWGEVKERAADFRPIMLRAYWAMRKPKTIGVTASEGTQSRGWLTARGNANPSAVITIGEVTVTVYNSPTRLGGITVEIDTPEYDADTPARLSVNLKDRQIFAPTIE